jgi:hypothetical protein
VTTLANKELQLLGIVNITRLGYLGDQGYMIGVYHRKTAHMQEELFDFKKETSRSNFPMLLALIFAMPISFKRRLKASIIGMCIMFFIESLGCILAMTWGYTFLPEYHKFTPFSDSAFRDAIVNFFFGFYDTTGDSVIILVIWAGLCLRMADFQRYFREMKPTIPNA